SDGLFHRRSRFGSAFRALDALAEAFVIRVEVEEKIFGIDSITRLVSLQHGFEEPRRVSDVPAWRAHEFRRLDDVILDLEWRDDPHRAGAHLLVKLRHRDGILP